MSDHTYKAETEGVRVQVKPEYLEDQSDPDVPRYVWAYHVAVTNTGGTTLQLEARTWNITDATGAVEEVKGPGVVGEQPILQPGDEFRYSSGCPLKTPSGFMQGSYTMLRDDGRRFEAQIPAFALDLPHAAGRLN